MAHTISTQTGPTPLRLFSLCVKNRKKETPQKTCVAIISKLTDFFHISSRPANLETLALIHSVVIGE